MAEFTIGERLLVHLYVYRSVNLDDYYNIPWDVTQDGISTSLRISRAHASIELKKQKERGNVRECQVRIHGGKVRRMAYALTEDGQRAAMEVEEKARNAGVDVRTLVDLKKQSTADLFESLSKKEKLALGMACALRVSVPASALPEHEASVIPVNAEGFTVIVPELRKRILSAADPADLREWHNLAFQYYDRNEALSVVQDDDLRFIEMVYHQLNAGMYVDACKRIQKGFYDLVMSDDRELYETVRDVPDVDIRDRYRLDFLSIRAELALSQRDLKTARETGEKLILLEGGQEEGYACLTECLLMRDLRSDARKTIEKVNGSGNVLGMLKVAEAYIDLDMIEEAKAQEAEALKILSDNNEAATLQHFINLARIDVAEGRTDDANRHISKALVSTNGINQRKVIAMAKNLGLVASEEIVLP